VKLVFVGGKFVCFPCTGINPYNEIQNTTKGGYRHIEYKMERFASRHGIRILGYPFHYFDYPRPPRKKVELWHKNIKILQALESMRNQSIFFYKKWSTKTIKSIEDGTNYYLTLPINEHLECFLPYDNQEIDINRFVFGRELCR